MKWLLTACPLIFFAWAAAAIGAPFVLTDEERAWIAEHPVVHVAADPDWKPIEYIENGQYMGLTSEYVRQIERLTGLQFEIVDNDGWGSVTDKLARKEVDVLPAMLRGFTTPSVADQVTFTHNYFIGTTVVITREQGSSIYDMHMLDGKIVSLKGGGAYQDRIHTLYPDVKILPNRTPDQELRAVVSGQADAAVGASAVLLPYLTRKYQGVLHVAGSIGSLPMELSMGVRNDLPILHSIINKSLSSLSAKETDYMVERWFGRTDYGAPSLPVLLIYYSPQLALVGFSLLLISGFALHARSQHRRAVRSEKEKTMFMAVLSHEIRSPMNAILASIELLQQSELPKEPRRLMDLASHSAEHLLRLLDDVLDISKLEAGRLQLDIAPMDIMELSRTVTDLLNFGAQEKGIALTLIEDSPITRRLMLDRLRVGQILHNLIGNAVKFTLNGGVTVTLCHETTSSEERQAGLYVGITDTGIGMDTAARERLFKPYSQASASTARKFGGTGLGLLICRQLVELMKGKIEIDSELNRGTTITVYLPCEMGAALGRVHNKPEATPMQKLQLSETSQLNVLLVEDTFANQAVFQAQLDVLGCRHRVAADGVSALRALDEESYDIVLLDCDLPDITGYEVSRRWREQETARGLAPTPILAISASTDTGHVSACFEVGMDGVLKKPIKLDCLRDALQLWSEASLVHVDDNVQVQPMLDYIAVVRELKADFNAMKLAHQADDAEKATPFAHRLVGAFEVLGAFEAAALARRLEHKFKHGGTDQISLIELDELETSLSDWANSSTAHK